MKFSAVLAGALVAGGLLGGSQAWSASPDALYLQAYSQISQADQYAATGSPEQARTLYEQARRKLESLQRSSPNYSPNAIDFRLEYIGQKLAALPAPEPAATEEQPVPPAQTVEGLTQQLEQARARIEQLRAKLEEVLAPKPAAVDPEELSKAQERILQLEKEKELLLADLEKTEAAQPQALDKAMLEQVKGELQATKRKLVEAVAQIATLTREAQALQTENAALRESAAPPAKVRELEAALAEAQAAAQEQASLANDLAKQLEDARAAAQEPVDGGGRIEALEEERDALMEKLAEANRELYDVKSRGELAQFETLTNQVYNLRARLEVFEARKVPFTEEELALLDKKPSLTASVDTRDDRQPVRRLPPEAALLVSRAERAFASRNFEEAEANYLEVLAMDERNPVTLGNLAAIQLEMGKLEEAEKHLQRALEQNPQDAYAMSLLGMVRFRQQKFDEALDLLSQAARLDPNNAETQNYLGITLSQQGQREAAETALRKAIQLAPNHPGAHHNLAVIYATQRPPFLELARFHYARARQLGQPPNEELEKEIGFGQ